MMEEDFTQQIKAMRNRECVLDHEGKYWSDDDNKKLRTMFNEGIGVTEMAIRLGRSETGVFQQIEKLKLYEPKYSFPRCTRGKPSAPEGCVCDKCPVQDKCSLHCST